MLPVILPVDRPPPFLHCADEFFPAGAFRDALHNGDCAVRYKAFPGFIHEEVIFVLAPGPDLPFLKRSAVEVFPFFRNSKAALPAEGIRIGFLPFEVPFCLVQLTAVDIGDRVRHDMDVQVVPVLMDPDQVLVFRKEPVGKRASDFEAFARADGFILMEADDIVGVHPAGILAPDPLLKEESLIYIVPVDSVRTVRTGDLHVPLFNLVIPEDIGDDVPHRAVALCLFIDDFIDSHISSQSFL